ncbi:MAG: hypothetical protein M3336_00370 [Chloroflexota bacterium]|nr:hypothetical protein [Chloroflexota bacterium]
MPANRSRSDQTDNVYEGDEHFLVQLSTLNATIARETATGTIVDDEVKHVLAISSTGLGVDEGNVDSIVAVDVRHHQPRLAYSRATTDTGCGI